MKKSAKGFFLLEALLAIFIFSLGVLAMVAMGATAIGAQSDAQYRGDATMYANEIATRIWLNVDRPLAATNASSSQRDSAIKAALLQFQHQPNTAATANGVQCNFSGPAATSPEVQAWVDEITTGARAMPGSTPSMLQIQVDTSTAGNNAVTITICWKAPADKVERKHTLITYVNG